MVINGSIWAYIFALVAIFIASVGCILYGGSFINVLKIVKARILTRFKQNHVQDIIFPTITKEQQNKISNALEISFTGDLILLREMIERAYNQKTGVYEFDDMFKHVSDIWKSSDLAIAVFEGPMGGREKGWSTSNYDDGIHLTLNFPDSFGKSVKDAGIDLVTLANNHLTDAGIDGALRTMDILDKICLPFVGAYRSKEEYDKIHLVHLHGKKIAIIAYTYGLNYIEEDFFFKGNNRYLTRPLVSPKSKYYKQNLKLIEDDLKKVKSSDADMIIVLPHMGEQFRHYPDKIQKHWCNIFVELGADIIFSDHTHAVQPLEWRKNKYDKNVLIVHCPGNFINSYVNYDGDASMIVRAYLDKDSLEPIGASVIPIYAYCPQNANWQGLPIYKALLSDELMDKFSRLDYRRMSEVHETVTQAALGVPIKIHNRQAEYITLPEIGYVRCIAEFTSQSDKFCGDNCMNDFLRLGGVNCCITLCYVNQYALLEIA